MCIRDSPSSASAGPESTPEPSDSIGPPAHWSGQKAVPSTSYSSELHNRELINAGRSGLTGAANSGPRGRVKPDASATP
eukprot:7664331-Alexandrium_andersonii.AAC.1